MMHVAYTANEGALSDGENLLQTVKSVIQDVVAPDVRELKVKVDALDKRLVSVEANLSQRISSVEANLGQRITSVETTLREQMTALERHITEQNTAHFRAILAAIEQNKAEANAAKAETELMVYKQIPALTTRVTAIEARLQERDEARAA